MNEYIASDMAVNRRQQMIADGKKKNPRNTFIGGVVIGVAIGFALGILGAAIFIHLVIFPIIL